MKKPKENFYGEIIEVLTELKHLYPTYSIGRHISTALEDYGDVWGTSDKEVLFAFTKYKAQMEMDVPHEAEKEELDEIIRDGMDLKNILRPDEDFINGQDY